MAADLPPVVIEERVQCSIAAALRYNIPANVMLAVAEQENGRPGARVQNTNNTADLGSMQLNSSYIQSLARYGIRPEYVLAAGCYPYNLAAWRIRNHIRDDKGDLWTRVANYHSRTPVHNARYRALIMAKGARWEAWLSSRYNTYSVNGIPVSGGAPAARSASIPLTITAADATGGGQLAAQPAIVQPQGSADASAGYVASILAAAFNARITDTWRDEKFLLVVAKSLLDAFPASDKSFSRLLGDVPVLPDSTLELLHNLCYCDITDNQGKGSPDIERVTQGLGTVWNLIVKRPYSRQACLDIALKVEIIAVRL